MICGDLNEKEIQKRGDYVYVWLIHFAVQWNLKKRKELLLKHTLGSDSCCQVAALTSMQEGLDTSDEGTDGTIWPRRDHCGSWTAASARMPGPATSLDHILCLLMAPGYARDRAITWPLCYHSFSSSHNTYHLTMHWSRLQDCKFLEDRDDVCNLQPSELPRA